MELRMLGIKMCMPGTVILQKLLRGEVKTEQLSENEIDLVLEAWDTRNFVPGNLAYPHEVDRVKPIITKKEVTEGLYTEKDYKRNFVEQIEKIFASNSVLAMSKVCQEGYIPLDIFFIK